MSMMMRTFSHMWVIDQDVVVPPLRYVRYFLHEARRHGALIAQPAVYGSVWRVLRPHPRCSTRATDFVELMMPMLQTRVALDVFTTLYRREAWSDWGVDTTWCKYAALRFQASPECLVVNSGRFVHPKAQTTANYSRSRALQEGSCVRVLHAALVSEGNDRACLD